MRTEHVFTYAADKIAEAATKKADYYADKAGVARSDFQLIQSRFTMQDWREIFKYLRGQLDSKVRESFTVTYANQIPPMLDVIDALSEAEALGKEYRQQAAAYSRQGATWYELSYADVLYFGLAE